MNKGIGLVLFIFGAAAGSLVAWQIVKKKYERIADEEINSVKDTFARKSTSGILEKPELSEYMRTVATINSVEEQDTETRAPYVISAEEFSENEDFRKVPLIFYADEVLSDDDGEEIENSNELVGANFASHFGEYGDSVYIRNEQRNVDYEIILDERNFSEIQGV